MLLPLHSWFVKSFSQWWIHTDISQLWQVPNYTFPLAVVKERTSANSTKTVEESWYLLITQFAVKQCFLFLIMSTVFSWAYWIFKFCILLASPHFSKKLLSDFLEKNCKILSRIFNIMFHYSHSFKKKNYWKIWKSFEK